MKYSAKDRSFYHLFVMFAIIEIIERTYISFPSMTIILAIGLYYWIYLTIDYVRSSTVLREFDGVKMIFLFLFWNLVIIIRGLFDSNDYWDYKTVLLNKGPFLFFALSIFLAQKIRFLKRILSFLIKYYLGLSMLFVRPELWSNTGRIISNLIPLSLFFIRKHQIWLFLFIFISIPFTWGARGWILRACYGLFLVLIFYLWKISFLTDKIVNTIFKLMYIICIIVPLILVYLGYTGKFNVFAMDQYISVENEEDIADTRSLLYEKVNDKLESSNKTWIGLGGISNYWDGYYANNSVSELQNKGRMGTESGVLNMYLYGGWIGAFLFSCLFWRSAYYGIYKSKNMFCRLTGCFLIFRWVVSFVDEPETWLCSNLMMYIFMGICLNRNLRNISNNQWYSWFKSICKV